MAKIKGWIGIFLVFWLVTLAGCGGGGGGGTSGTESAVIPATTKVLDSATTQKLAAVSADQSNVTFSGTTQQLSNVKTGDIIVSGITSTTPEGLLRKVSAIQQNPDGTTTILTDPTTLDEAVQKGSFSFNKSFSPNDVVATKTLAKGVNDVPLAISPGSFSITLTNK